MLLVIDNYDSFTYNLVQFLGELGAEPVVCRNDQITVEQIAKADYRGLVISPGPGEPKGAGVTLAAIRQLAGSLPILGVCLGHQAIGEAFGGKLINLSTVYHGVATKIEIQSREPGGESFLFNGLSKKFSVGRYHSWIVSEENFPEELEVTARDDNNYIMALQHRKYDVQGVQFHPESVLTPDGEKIMRNWLK